ncbi:hypothetical protein [Flavobacterium tructae]|nr:hypothetical protein [Flavobacterium tructae]
MDRADGSTCVEKEIPQELYFYFNEFKFVEIKNHIKTSSKGTTYL